ncbi:MAG: hypothetical protein J6K04_04760 [Lachnospiraceae bacterium]|nr:hypothetical protein [Lachnospiraceae bacterium]
MKDIIHLLKETLRYFVIITVLVLFVSASYITIFYGLDSFVTVKVLWQILFVSFLGSLSHILFRTKENKVLTKKGYYVRWLLCYVYVNIMVLGFGWLFEWFDISSLPMVIGMLVAILVVFLVVAAFVFWMDAKTSEEINQKLKERNAELDSLEE